MYCGVDVTEVELPVTVRLAVPTVLINVVATLAENCTVEVTVPELLVTDTVKLFNVYGYCMCGCCCIPGDDCMCGCCGSWGPVCM